MGDSRRRPRGFAGRLPLGCGLLGWLAGSRRAPAVRVASLLAVLGLGASLPGCAAVRPWERETLALEEMAWEPDSLEAAQRSHVYWSKEASLPGGSTGGGGCGCN